MRMNPNLNSVVHKCMCENSDKSHAKTQLHKADVEARLNNIPNIQVQLELERICGLGKQANKLRTQQSALIQRLKTTLANKSVEVERGRSIMRKSSEERLAECSIAYWSGS